MGQEPVWSQQSTRQIVALMLATCISFWLVILLPFDEPWNWLMAGLSVMLAAAFVTQLVARVVLRQRDDYWHERNQDAGS